MEYHKRVRTLRWYGGKQGYGKAEWICSLLPWRKESVYVEPFGGMASVMARRAPVKCEIFNDLDSRVVNWFRMWRERTEEMTKLVCLTPHSREEYERAWHDREHPDPLRRAWAFHVVTQQGLISSPDSPAASWLCDQLGTRGSLGRWMPDRCEDIAERFLNVQLENVEAVSLLRRLKGSENAIIYCDPPYRTSDVKPYRHAYISVDVLTSVLLSQAGQVAISGYGDEWDHLGWQRHERDALYRYVGEPSHRGGEKRTEVLWTSYDVNEGKNIGGLFAEQEEVQ